MGEAQGTGRGRHHTQQSQNSVLGQREREGSDMNGGGQSQVPVLYELLLCAMNQGRVHLGRSEALYLSIMQR